MMELLQCNGGVGHGLAAASFSFAPASHVSSESEGAFDSGEGEKAEKVPGAPDESCENMKKWAKAAAFACGNVLVTAGPTLALVFVAWKGLAEFKDLSGEVKNLGQQGLAEFKDLSGEVKSLINKGVHFEFSHKHGLNIKKNL